jgi:hypothetical protein
MEEDGGEFALFRRKGRKHPSPVLDGGVHDAAFHRRQVLKRIIIFHVVVIVVHPGGIDDSIVCCLR